MQKNSMSHAAQHTVHTGVNRKAPKVTVISHWGYFTVEVKKVIGEFHRAQKVLGFGLKAAVAQPQIPQKATWSKLPASATFSAGLVWDNKLTRRFQDHAIVAHESAHSKTYIFLCLVVSRITQLKVWVLSNIMCFQLFDWSFPHTWVKTLLKPSELFKHSLSGLT